MELNYWEMKKMLVHTPKNEATKELLEKIAARIEEIDSEEMEKYHNSQIFEGNV